MNLKYLLKRERHAQLWKRVFAYGIDTLIVALIVAYPFRSLTDSFNLNDGFFSFKSAISPEKTKLMMIAFLIITLLSVLYWAILEFRLRQSIGKILMRIYVKPLTKELSFWQCIIRNITKVSTFTIFLDTAYMFFTRQHQRYFEKLSNTEVIEK